MNALPTLLFLTVLLITTAITVGFTYLIKRGNHYKLHRNRLLREKEVMLDYVHDVGEAFSDAENIGLDSFLERVLFYSMRTSKASAGAIYMSDPGGETLRCHAVAGVFPPLAGRISAEVDQASSKSEYLNEFIRAHEVKKGEGIIGEAADFGVSVLVDDADRDARVPKYEIDYLKIKSLLIVPMRFRNRVIGVLVVVNRIDGEVFTRENLNLLEGLASQASASAHFISLRETIEEQKRIQHDLELARNIQVSLLPRNIPQVPGFNIAAFNRPALAIGGDYYDVVKIDDAHIGLAVADVSGKGIPGALLMSSCRSILRAQAKGNLDGRAVLCEINRSMTEDMSIDMFVSMLYMILNTETREMSIFRAGHTAPLIWRSEKSRIETFEGAGVAIGLTDPEIFESTLEEQRVTLNSGDAVVGYTDGITEAMNPDENEWGLERFESVIVLSAGEDADTMLANVSRRLAEFTGNALQSDDMTMLVVKVA